MSKINMKIAGVLATYALLITSLFVAGILFFASYSSNDRIDFYLQSQEMEIDSTADNGTKNELTNPDNERMTDLKNYADYYHDNLMQKIAVIASVFCVFLIVSSLALWLILKKIQKNENIKIAEQLNSIQKMNDFMSDDPILTQAFLNIKNEFDRHLTDYKRLHTYLSHEQKNALALLRANLELHHEEACLQNIEDISMGIDDLVTLSESDDRVEVKPVDVIMLCADVVDKYVPHYPLLKYDFDENTLYVSAKPRWIVCALNNLIDNAIKYGNKNEIYITVKGTASEVIVSVKDNGIGIPAEKQKEIFEQNYRVNELNKDGYGIGLSLVQHVCDLCKGKIICKSEPDTGSEFLMRFPRVYCEETASL